MNGINFLSCIKISLIAVVASLLSTTGKAATGGPGNAVYFNGITNFVEVSSSPLLNRYPLTISAWIKPDSSSSNQVLVSKMKPTDTNGWSLIQDGSNLTAILWYKKNLTNYSLRCSTTDSPIKLQQWNNVAATLADTGIVLYVNGIQKVTAAPLASSVASSSNLTSIRFGGQSTGAPKVDSPYVGTMDEMIYYSPAASLASLGANLHTHPLATDTNLVAYFACDEGTSSTLLSYTTNGNSTGSFKNLPIWVKPSTAPIGSPLVTTLGVSNVTPTSATLNGIYDNRARASTIWFDWGTSTNYTQKTAFQFAVTNQFGASNVSATLSGLTGNQLYYYRLSVSNLLGVFSDTNVTFSTLHQPPDVLSQNAFPSNASQVTLAASFNPHSDAGAYWFELGNSPSLGQSTTPVNYSASNNNINVTLSLSNLVQLTNYYWRLNVSNIGGVTHGDVLPFTTVHFVSVSSTPPVGNDGLYNLMAGDFLSNGKTSFIVSVLPYLSDYYIYPNYPPFLWLAQIQGTNIAWSLASQSPQHLGSSFAVGDFDGDGKLDLLEVGIDYVDYTYNYNGDTVYGAWLWHNDGGTFRQIALPGFNTSVYQLSQVVAGDFDGDGRLDFAVVDGYNPTEYWHNDGNGYFSFAGLISSNVDNAAHLACVDLNRDGQPDLTSFSSYDVNIFTNQDGVFSPALGFAPSGLNFYSSGLVADFNQDGKLLVLVNTYDLGSNVNRTLIISPSTGQVYSNAFSQPFGTSPLMATVDVNGDGLPDVASGFPYGVGAYTASLHLNTGNLHFQDLYDSLFTPTFYGLSVWADLDGDGKPDLVTMDGSSLQVWFNRINSNNTTPSAPTGLVVSTNAQGKVLLKWNPAFDPQGSSGLTYRVHYSTNAAIAGVFPPYTPEASPIYGTNFSIWLTNLPAGAVYWSVLAVDSGLLNSPASAPVELDLPGAPAINLTYVSQLIGNHAQLNSQVKPFAAPGIVWFEWGTDLSLSGRTVSSPFVTTSLQNASATISNLTAGTLYYYRAAASNSFGLTYGAVQAFVTATPPPPPVFSSINRTGAGVDLRWTSETGTPFTVLGTTNATLPMSQWTPLGIATEISYGQFRYLDTISSNVPYRFYRLRTP